ncbi:hypothetical protein Dimus_027853 [Dionaea muscipula]
MAGAGCCSAVSGVFVELFAIRLDVYDYCNYVKFEKILRKDLKEFAEDFNELVMLFTVDNIRGVQQGEGSAVQQGVGEANCGDPELEEIEASV